MGGGPGMMSAKLCDACKTASATVFCRADSAFLCISCDTEIHAANKLASRHARVWVCEVCEQSPACVTCKADAAHLCATCDHDIHSANPLARRHDRVPLSPFFDIPSDSCPPTNTVKSEPADSSVAAAAAAAKSAAICKLFGEEYYSDADEVEAASWLLPSSKAVEEHTKSIDYLFGGVGGGNDGGEGIDPYLDLDFGADPKPDPSADGVVPNPDQKEEHHHQQQHHHHQIQQQAAMYPMSAYSSQYEEGGYDHNLKAYTLSSFAAAATTHHPPSLSHSVSSSSLDFGVVPDASAMADVASTGVGGIDKPQMKILGLDREARVLRYREKRKNRKFEKTIRYASRKAYAETRPRIKGRFAKRTDVEAELSAASVDCLFASDPGYGVVPSF